VSSPPPPANNRHYGWLWLLVALQVAIPASYYVRADRDDERFAWRMFSAVRVKRCEVELREQHEGVWQEVDMAPVVHASWRNALKRGRRRVIERLLEKRCEQPGTEAAELLRRCKNTQGERYAPERTRLSCADGSWSREEGGG
jgi:hypothetical protein